jgi:Coenzyme PQQ synthesis protein D (PqqD)
MFLWPQCTGAIFGSNPARIVSQELQAEQETLGGMDELLMIPDAELKLTKRKDVSERTVEGETLILDRTNGRVHHLNSTASYIWQHCDGLSPRAIAQQLAETFQVDATSAEPDVDALLGEMREMNLLETHNPRD